MKKDSSGLVNRTRLGSPISKENKEKLEEVSKRTGIPMSRLADEALELLFKQYKEDEEAASKEII